MATEITVVKNNNQLLVNPNGSINTNSTILGTLVPESFDTIEATYPTTSSEVYTYKKNSSTVATVTVTYTDSTKATLTSVVRS